MSGSKFYLIQRACSQLGDGWVAPTKATINLIKMPKKLKQQQHQQNRKNVNRTLFFCFC